MFAVIKTGGKQYKVAKGQVLILEKLAALPGKKVQFNDVLLLGGEKTVLGTPRIKDAGVQAEVMDQIRGDKTISFVKRRRKSSSQRKKGHRQSLTVVKITDILASGAEKSGVEQANGAGGSSVDYGNFSSYKSNSRGSVGHKREAQNITSNKLTSKEIPKKASSPLKRAVEKKNLKDKATSKQETTKKVAATKTIKGRKASQEKSTKKGETKKSKAVSNK